MKQIVEIYTDGSAKANGTKENCGGFGVCCLIPDENCKTGFRVDFTVSQQILCVTNNRMELKAIIEALRLSQTRYKDYECVIKSDSAYCVNMINDWIYHWFRNGWTRAKGEPIENLDLIKEIWEYLKIDFANFRVEKILGHANIPGNEIADALATNNKVKLEKILIENDSLYEKGTNFDLQ